MLFRILRPHAGCLRVQWYKYVPFLTCNPSRHCTCMLSTLQPGRSIHKSSAKRSVSSRENALESELAGVQNSMHCVNLAVFELAEERVHSRYQPAKCNLKSFAGRGIEAEDLASASTRTNTVR